MSATFDPTKLDLDINNETPKEENKNSDTQETQNTIQEENKTPITQSSDDILGEITISSGKEKEESAVIGKDSSPEDVLASPIQEENTKKEEPLPKEPKKEKKLIDINIESLESIITLIDEKEYDYAIIEPEDMQVKVTFKQDNIDRDIKYIKFPIYTNILFKLKQKTGLEMEAMEAPQEGKGKLQIGGKKYKLATKVVPGQNGERIWLKSQEDLSEKGKKKVKKTSLSIILGFLGAILFVGLILGGAFIGFTVFTANSLSDVKFFSSLGINLNDINAFLGKIVTFIFSLLIFFSTAALSFALFKFFLTKKIYKQKKVRYGLYSSVLLILTLLIGWGWKEIYERVQNLPNWAEENESALRIFDNSLLISSDFDEKQAQFTTPEEIQNLIGPITLQFNLEFFEKRQKTKGFIIKKYVWNFGDESVESFSPTITRLFDKKGNYEVTATAIGTNLQGEDVEQVITNIPAIGISHLIIIGETILKNGGKKLSFDANDLKNLGKIEWYFKEASTEEGQNPEFKEWTNRGKGYDFFPNKIFFDEIFVGVSIMSGDDDESTIDKVIVIQPDGVADIEGSIEYEQSIEDELSFTFFVKDQSTGLTSGFIENYQWTIGEKTYLKSGDFSDTQTSPKVEHIFKNFGEHTIEVILTDSKGKSETLEKIITIQKSVTLRSPLQFKKDNGDEIEDFRYEEKAHEYFIDDFGIPSSINIDARYVRPKNVIYSLQTVTWDVGDNGDIDATGKTFEYEVPTEGNHILVANYHFVHRKNPDDTIDLKEHIYIEGIKKEAILDLKIEKNSNYAPVLVRFDASQSFIKNEDIIKFIYDYGDGVSEERDSINPGHRYGVAGDYTVKLTVVGKTGKTYSIEKKLILLPPPQEVKITTSLKRAPIGQGIDFSSAESEGQIVEYFWNFGDGKVSTEANPTHSYERPGIYEVELTVDFSNNNTIPDSVKIEIFEESN